MNVIQFPGGADTRATPRSGRGKKPPAMKLTQPPVPHAQMTLGPLKFTCPCGHAFEIGGTGAILRVLDCYCGGCGVLHRIQNPAFTR